MSYRPVEVVEVRCWEERVGAVALDPGTGFYAFEYSRNWIKKGIELAPTTMPISDPKHVFIFPSLPVRTYYRLPAMLADSLPDDFGNALTNAYLSSQGITPDKITPLDRLAYLGTRGMGALEFHPIRGPRTRKSTAIELLELVTAARSVISNKIDTEKELTAALNHLIAVGTSAGGARAKAVISINPETGELRSGQVAPDPGFESWILKLDGVGNNLEMGKSSSFGRIEFAYYLMAKSAGIDMMESRLLDEGQRAHFMTRRFDRDVTGGKVHSQTLCAMAHMDFRQIGTNDYSQLFHTINQLGMGAQTRAEAFRRMVFNVAALNCDDHSKNFSFILAELDTWKLAPGYDITYAHSPESKWTRQHLMSVNGKTENITFLDLWEIADRFNVPNATEIIEKILDSVAAWPTFADQAGVPKSLTDKIFEEIESFSKQLKPKTRRSR